MANNWKKAHQQAFKKANPKYWVKYTRKRLADIATLKQEAGCVDCGYDLNSVALDFDHVRGKKFRDVSRMLTYSWERIRAEIEKCDVVCANCHRIRTSTRPLSEHQRSPHDKVKHTKGRNR